MGKQRFKLEDNYAYPYFLILQDSRRAFSTHSDPDGLSMLLESWQTLGLPQDEMDLCLRVISAVLHLGNITFKSDNDKVGLAQFILLNVENELTDFSEL